MSAYQPIIARLLTLHPKRIDLSLDRMWRILAALGHPERRLPPVIHVAGTNGKGSTIAFMRAVLEAAGKTRPRLHLAASGALQRALSARRAGWRPAGRATRRWPMCCWNASAPTAREPITVFEIETAAAFLSVLAPSGRCAAARSRPRRPARRDQRDRHAARQRDHAGVDRSSRISRRHHREDRRREGRDPQARRAGGDRAAGARRR